MILETERLKLVELDAERDAAFMLALLNEPSFIQFIGDRGVRDLAQAQQYLLDGPIASYRDNGFGMYLVQRKADGCQLGVCGLVKRQELDDVDIGFAFFPEHWSSGYASEAAAAVLNMAHTHLGIRKIVAITDAENHGSARVLEKIGLRFDRLIDFAPDEPPLRLFVTS